MPASWNSYSKSDAALKPLNIILDLYLLHRSVVKDLNDMTLIFFLSNFRSENKAFFIISILSSASNKYFLFSPSDTATIIFSNSFKDFLITSMWPKDF